VETVSQCVIAVTEANSDQPPRDCTDADPVSPAQEAGFQAGDRIVAINGTRVGGWTQIQHLIRANGAKPATVVVVRDGQELTLRPSTVVSPRLDPDNPERITKVGFLGVSPTSRLEPQGPGYVVGQMADGTWQTLQTIGALPVKVYHVGRAALGLEERDPTGPMSVVGAGRVAGEVAAQEQISVTGRFMSLILLLAGLNLFLGLIKLGRPAAQAPRPGWVRQCPAATGDLRDGRPHPRGQYRADLRRHRGAGLDQLTTGPRPAQART
jgi:membrane-associated protease RseP (regulator of RpoE activity)